MAFVAGPPPIVSNAETQQLITIIWEKFQMLETLMGYLGIDELHSEPAKPLEGMVVYADGSDWNPGSGQGIYRWDGSAWEKL